MKNLNPDDFEEILDSLRNKISNYVECDNIRAIESNSNTKGMKFKSRDDSGREGTIIVGEDKELIAVDISLQDGSARSFILDDKKDANAVENIAGWFEENY